MWNERRKKRREPKMAMTTVETYDAIFNLLVLSFSLGDGGSLILSGLVS